MAETFRRFAVILAAFAISVLTLPADASADEASEPVALTVEVDCSKPVHRMENFWNRFGFSPAWDLFKDHYQVYMAYAGSVPHEGLEYARIHRTLNLIGAKRDGNAIVYDWSKLDAATDILLRYRLKHHFEFDYKGRGSELISNRGGARSRKEAEHHRAVTRALAEHFVERYGRDEVASWWWESPNEGQLKWNEAGVAYWDAVTKGLADVDKRFARRFGGPAAIYRKNPYDFVKLLESTENIFTGKKEHTVGFVSGHIKAAATDMVDSEIEMIKKIRKDFPSYKDVPFVNTEHDPWNGWNNKHEWARGPKFAAWTANAIYQEQLRIIEGMGQPFFCSNDSGFLSDNWDRRTQMILFREKDRFALIKKPAHTVFTSLAKLGDGRLAVKGNPDVRSGVGVLATRNSAANGQVAVLAFNDGKATRTVTVKLRDLPGETLMLSHLRHDANTSNPYRVWPHTKTPPSRGAGQTSPRDGTRLRSRSEEGLARGRQAHARRDHARRQRQPLPAHTPWRERPGCPEQAARGRVSRAARPRAPADVERLSRLCAENLRTAAIRRQGRPLEAYRHADAPVQLLHAACRRGRRILPHPRRRPVGPVGRQRTGRCPRRPEVDAAAKHETANRPISNHERPRSGCVQRTP